MKRIAGHVATAAIGALLGAVAMLLIAPDPARDGTTSPPESDRAAPAYRVLRPAEAPPETSARLLLAWSPMGSGGLPPATEKIVEAMPGVSDATTVHAGPDRLTGSRLEGSVVDGPPPGYPIPIETAVVDPTEYARFVPPSERDAFLSLGPGEAVMAQTETRIRGAGRGLVMSFPTGDVTVASVVSDIATNGYEIVRARPVPSSWQRVDRFLLMHLRPRADRAAIARKIKSLLAPGQVLRVREEGETPFLRYGDAVLPELLVKESFGEFPARPLPDGTIDIPQSWRNRNLRNARVPILGEVTCHRALFPQLRAALHEVENRGLGFLINPAQYGGCFGPRFIGREVGGRLSHHSWGIAVDLNVAENTFGTRPDQDPRLVKIMEDHGFTWGGRWLVPDGMHFEWVRFP